jgi:uncharacterized phage protein gp47/JayE
VAFEQSFDELLNSILTDYKNQFPEADISQGSLIFIKSSCLASALWGLYQYQGYISRQIFPDTADTENLEHHAWVRGVARKVNEGNPDLLARLLEYIRRPPAGGNQYDYVKWALEIQDVKSAYCVPLGQGLGSVDVIIIADATRTGSEIPTQTLLNTVKAYIDDLRPVTAKYCRVLAPTFVTQDVTITGSGTGWDKNTTASDITTYLSTFVPNQTLYRSQLVNFALLNGADDATCITPSANVIPTANAIIRPGTISVT